MEAWSTALWELLVLGLLILWGVQILGEGRIRLALNPLVWPMMGLLMVGAAQIVPLASGERAAISYNSFATGQAMTKILASLVFFLLFASFVHNDERRDVTVKVILAVCVLIALVGIGQAFIGKALWQRGSFGPFVNRNHFSGFLEMGVGLAGGLLIGRSVKRELMAVYASCLLILCAGIVLSASRGGMLALGAEILFLAVVAVPLVLGSGKQRPGKGAVLIRSVGALILGAAAIVGSLFLVGSEGLVRNISQNTGEAESARPIEERFSRRDIWSATASIVRDHPWLGVGLGAFQYAYPRYDPSSGAQRVEQTHNDYLQALVDGGIVGGLMALAFVVILFARGFIAAQTHHRRRRSIVLGALAGCFAIAVHSFVDFNLQITANAQLFLALAALATPPRHLGSAEG